MGSDETDVLPAADPPAPDTAARPEARATAANDIAVFIDER